VAVGGVGPTPPEGLEPQPLSLREQRRLNRRSMSEQHVLDVAERLFGDSGYQSTSLEQIALGSEFSVGAVHKMFNGKTGLLSAVMSRRYTEMRADLLGVLAQSLPGLDEVLAICAYYVDYYVAHPSVARLHLRVYGTGIEPSPDFEQYRRAAADGDNLFVGAIKRGQREGTIRDGRPAWIATIIQGLSNFDRSLRLEPSPPATKEEFLSLVRNAIVRP
jgi:AcrR family transcriptional regulator